MSKNSAKHAQKCANGKLDKDEMANLIRAQSVAPLGGVKNSKINIIYFPYTPLLTRPLRGTHHQRDIEAISAVHGALWRGSSFRRPGSNAADGPKGRPVSCT